jgi:hypothetical protein
MATRGRPPSLDADRRKQIISVLATGGSTATAAALVGCCTRTIYNTAQREPEFKDQMRAARAHDEIKLLRCIDRAAEDPRYWRAAAWKLERLHPERYARRDIKQITVPLVNEFLRSMLTDIVLPMIPDKEEQLKLADCFDQRKNEFLADHDNVVELALQFHSEQHHPPPADAA